MIKSTIEIRKLTADKGMVLTNGKTYGKEVCLGVNSRVEDWVEITEERYQEIKAEQEARDESDNIT